MEFDLQTVIDNIPSGYIAKSVRHGYGLFAAQPLLSGCCLCALDGQQVPWDLYHTISAGLSEQLSDSIFIEWNALREDLLLVRPFRTKYSFINHSRTPNAAVLQDPLRVVAICDIALDEEILLDYRKEALNEEYLAGHGKTYL